MGFVSIRYGMTLIQRNDYHEEKRFLYSYVPRNRRYGTQGHRGKPPRSARRQKGEGRARAQAVAVFTGRDGQDPCRQMSKFRIGWFE